MRFGTEIEIAPQFKYLAGPFNEIATNCIPISISRFQQWNLNRVTVLTNVHEVKEVSTRKVGFAEL